MGAANRALPPPATLTSSSAGPPIPAFHGPTLIAVLIAELSTSTTPSSSSRHRRKGSAPGSLMATPSAKGSTRLRVTRSPRTRDCRAGAAGRQAGRQRRQLQTHQLALTMPARVLNQPQPFQAGFLPSRRTCAMALAPVGSTPMTWMLGLRALTMAAMPAIMPPPPAIRSQTSIQSMDGARCAGGLGYVACWQARWAWPLAAHPPMGTKMQSRSRKSVCRKISCLGQKIQQTSDGIE